MNDQKDKDWQSVADEPIENEADLEVVAEATDEEASADKKKTKKADKEKMTETDELHSENAALRTELDKAKDALLRMHAEMENLRRRTQREISHAHQYSFEKFARELLSILDSLEQGLSAGNNDQLNFETLHKGMELTHKLLLDTFDKFKIEQINPQGEPFDSHFHEAISMQETTEAKPDTVVQVMQKGYKLHDRVLRPARVIVAKAPE